MLLTYNKSLSSTVIVPVGPDDAVDLMVHLLHAVPNEETNRLTLWNGLLYSHDDYLNLLHNIIIQILARHIIELSLSSTTENVRSGCKTCTLLLPQSATITCSVVLLIVIPEGQINCKGPWLPTQDIQSPLIVNC